MSAAAPCAYPDAEPPALGASVANRGRVRADSASADGGLGPTRPRRWSPASVSAGRRGRRRAPYVQRRCVRQACADPRALACATGRLRSAPHGASPPNMCRGHSVSSAPNCDTRVQGAESLLPEDTAEGDWIEVRDSAPMAARAPLPRSTARIVEVSDTPLPTAPPSASFPPPPETWIASPAGARPAGLALPLSGSTPST